MVRPAVIPNEEDQARTRLARIARPIAANHRDRLITIRAEAEEKKELERADWLWHALLGAFAVMGSVRGVVLLRDPEYYNRVKFDVVKNLSRAKLKRVLKDTLRLARVRFYNNKAAWLVEAFERIEREGGPAAAKKSLLSAAGRDAKIAFLTSFRGINDKNARNVMMNVCHADFDDSIAIDARIKSISKALGLSFKGYQQHEHLYLGVAHLAGLTGWELDRLMFGLTKEFTDALRRKYREGRP